MERIYISEFNQVRDMKITSLKFDFFETIYSYKLQYIYNIFLNKFFMINLHNVLATHGRPGSDYEMQRANLESFIETALSLRK